MKENYLELTPGFRNYISFELFFGKGTRCLDLHPSTHYILQLCSINVEIRKILSQTTKSITFLNKEKSHDISPSFPRTWNIMLLPRWRRKLKTPNWWTHYTFKVVCWDYRKHTLSWNYTNTFFNDLKPFSTTLRQHFHKLIVRYWTIYWATNTTRCFWSSPGMPNADFVNHISKIA